jgi:hypothetical protein
MDNDKSSNRAKQVFMASLLNSALELERPRGDGRNLNEWLKDATEF